MKNITFKAYKLGDLFEVKATKKTKLSGESGTTPLMGYAAINNMIRGYVKEQPTEEGNVITYFNSGDAAEICYYQPTPFIGNINVDKLEPYEKDQWNEKSFLYVLTVIKKAFHKFDWYYKATRQRIKEIELYLPTNEKNEIDFNYMEQFIKDIEQEVAKDEKTKQIEMVQNSLDILGLDNYELTKEEEALLELDPPEFMEFKLGDLFDICTPKKIFRAIDVKIHEKREDGFFHYVGLSEENNGVAGYIKEDTKFLNEGNTIVLTCNFYNVFYKKEPYFATDHIRTLKPKTFTLNEKIAPYLVTSIKKGFINFDYNNSYKMEILENVTIKLPIRKNHTNEKYNIDFDYMERYITAVYKITIKDYINESNEIIKRLSDIIED